MITVSKAPPGSAPSFTSQPLINQIQDGVIFEAQLKAIPSPTIQWFKGTTPIADGDRYRIVTQTDGTNYALSLEISRVAKEDGGSYKVTAKNSLGEANANINLNLEGMTLLLIAWYKNASFNVYKDVMYCFGTED